MSTFNSLTQEIPFAVVASSTEHSHLFILQETNEGVGSVICRFTALQKEGGIKILLALTLLRKVRMFIHSNYVNILSDHESQIYDVGCGKEYIKTCLQVQVRAKPSFGYGSFLELAPAEQILVLPLSKMLLLMRILKTSKDMLSELLAVLLLG